jgi:hypothetical protein
VLRVTNEEDSLLFITEICVIYKVMGTMCVVIARMFSGIPFPHKRTRSCPANEHLLFVWRIYGHKMVSVVKHKMSLIIFFQNM